MALFDRLSRRVAERAREMADEALARAEAAVAQFPDIRLRRDGEALVIEAMGLIRRWMNDVRLRFMLWRGR